LSESTHFLEWYRLIYQRSRCFNFASALVFFIIALIFIIFRWHPCVDSLIFLFRKLKNFLQVFFFFFLNYRDLNNPIQRFWQKKVVLLFFFFFLPRNFYKGTFWNQVFCF
jgi:hypothetical protein